MIDFERPNNSGDLAIPGLGQDCDLEALRDGIASGEIDGDAALAEIEAGIDRGDINPETLVVDGGVVATIRPERSLWHVIQQRNARLADFLDAAPGLCDLLQKVVISCTQFATRVGAPAQEIVAGDCRWEQTPTGGNLIVSIRREHGGRR